MSQVFFLTGHQMKNQKDILNKIIPADDLYWDETEKKYIVHSQEEIKSILTSCINNDISEQEEVMKVFNWCTTVKVGELLMKGFLTGKIVVLGFDKHNEPLFGQPFSEDINNQS
jgi:hypothetical protein